MLAAAPLVVLVAALTAAPGAAPAVGASTLMQPATVVSGGPIAPDAVLEFGAVPGAPAVRSFAPLDAPIVGITAAPGRGDWLVAADGGVFSVGGAHYLGSAAGRQLPAPVVGIAPTSSGKGYWLVGADGSVYSYGDAHFFGDVSRLQLAEPIVGIAATPDGHGYWLAGADGGVFAFGDARFRGSATTLAGSDRVVGIAAAREGTGYWLVDATGDVLAFGSASLHGSASTIRLDAPIVGMAPTSDDGGYWLVGADGGVFSFGDARFHGSSASAPGAPVVGIAPLADDGGYWLASGAPPAPPPFLAEIAAYAPSRGDNVSVGVYDIKNGQTYAYRPGVVEFTASTVKVDILGTLLNETQSHGPLSPGLQALAVPMIEDSLDSAADALWDQVGPAAVGAFDRAAGTTETVPPPVAWWATTTTTVEDRLAVLRAVVLPNDLLTPTSRAYILYLMEHVTPDQDWGATGGVPAGVTVALKNGFAFVDDWQMNTIGWVDGDGRDYLIAILTNGNETESYGIATVNAVSAMVWNGL
jgi:hypothetical protein